MTKIQFQDPVFNEGPNLTCRKGLKWANITGTIEIVQTGQEDIVIGYAKITDVKVIPFDSITDDLLKNEHAPYCRTWKGLLAGMKDVYPLFDEREIITMVYFDFIKVLEYEDSIRR